jgi:hypothetical protein
MNLIEKLSNFEEIKRSGFIEYDEDGSGVYYIYKYDGKLFYSVEFNQTGSIMSTTDSHIVKRGGNIVNHLITMVDIYRGIYSKLSINKAIEYDHLGYIDGWVREKIDEYYREAQ